MRRTGAKDGSIKRFGDIVRAAAVHGDWSTLDDATLEGAEKFLAHKRENGWSGTTHDQGCSALRCFGRFVAKRKWVQASPFEHLESSGEQGGTGSRAARTDDVRTNRESRISKDHP